MWLEADSINGVIQVLKTTGLPVVIYKGLVQVNLKMCDLAVKTVFDDEERTLLWKSA